MPKKRRAQRIGNLAIVLLNIMMVAQNIQHQTVSPLTVVNAAMAGVLLAITVVEWQRDLVWGEGW